MSNPIFPLQSKQDSAYLAVEREDNTIVGSLEGGYEHTRPRTTKAPRTTFSTGFTRIVEADHDTLQAFYDQVGKHSVFDWTHPTKATTHVCRIVEWPQAQNSGAGSNLRFNLGPIRIKEV